MAERASSLRKGASARLISELLLAKRGWSVSSKTITRILKEAGLRNPFFHKGPRNRKCRNRMERFGQMLQINASPFDWLSNDSMISLHGCQRLSPGAVDAPAGDETMGKAVDFKA